MRCSIVRRRSSSGSSNRGAHQRSAIGISRVKGVEVKPKWLLRSTGLSGIFVIFFVSFGIRTVRADDGLEVGLEGSVSGGGWSGGGLGRLRVGTSPTRVGVGPEIHGMGHDPAAFVQDGQAGTLRQVGPDGGTLYGVA